MKKKYVLLLTACIIMLAGKSQVIIMNGDTINRGMHNKDTIYYCNSITVKVGNGTDTTGVFGNPSMLFWPISSDTILTSGTFTPTDTMMVLWVDDSTKESYWKRNPWNYDSSSGWLSMLKVHFKKIIPTSKICWVTVDSNFAHNVIIWDSTGFAAEGIDSIKVYYYYTATQKMLLATLPRTGNTYYVDSVNNPNSGTFKYLVAGVNGCGNLDTNSAWQTTAWIQQTGSTFTVSSAYTVEGDATPVSYYILYRDTTGLGYNWDSIFETPGTVLNDPNYSNYPNAKYYVAAVLNLPGCTAPAITDRAESAVINKSKSNRVNNQVTGIAPVGGIGAYHVAPNPNNGVFNLYTDGLITGKVELHVYNVLGMEIYQAPLLSGKNQVDIRNEPPGMYIYRIVGGDGRSYGSGKLTIEE